MLTANYAGCHNKTIMLSVVMLSVVMLSVIMLSVVAVLIERQYLSSASL